MEEMVALSGQSKAPTLDWDGEVLADFGVEELVQFLEGEGLRGRSEWRFQVPDQQ